MAHLRLHKLHSSFLLLLRLYCAFDLDEFANRGRKNKLGRILNNAGDKKSCDPFPRLNPHTVNFFCSERQHTKRRKGRAGTTWKCVVGFGLLLWARTPLMRGKNAQQEADLTRTMPVILSNMNHRPSNTNKYCSNTSGS